MAETFSTDPCIGRSIRFEDGGPSQINSGHLVALGDVWQKGAATWLTSKRTARPTGP